MFDMPETLVDLQESRKPQPRSYHSVISYMLTCGVVIGLSIITFQYGVAANLTSLFQDIASNLTSAM